MTKLEIPTKRLLTWNGFQKLVNQLSNSPSAGAGSNLLFRGQSNADWGLQTTLERWVGNDQIFEDYFSAISAMQPEVESRTKLNWKLPQPPDYSQFLAGQRIVGRFPLVDDLYEYMVYLRHHGFPSPLLDWSRSPYVAAYFAFRNVRANGKAAIFAYRETSGQGKTTAGGQPQINGLGPYVRAHERHFLQQSEYTVCFSKEQNKVFTYKRHESVWQPNKRQQDTFLKITLPGRLREDILDYLRFHNITAYSLLGDEDSLMETMAMREFGPSVS